MKKRIFAALVLILVFSTSLFSQERWEVQFRPGINFPTEDFTGTSLETGFGFEITGAYHLLPHLGIYIGWGWNQFGANELLGASKVDLEETGYSFGLQYMHPFKNSTTAYFFHVGAIYHHLELEDLNGEIALDSGHGLGWQTGAGISMSIGSNYFLRPTLRYRSLSRDLNMANTILESKLNYVSFGIGLVKDF